MSVIVKSMEMPPCCFNCNFHSDILNGCRKQTWCHMLKRNTGDVTEKRPQDCPLVELPEKHGRLINADFVIEKASHEAKAMDEPFKSNFDVLVKWIVDKTPTVIEAEGSE